MDRRFEGRDRAATRVDHRDARASMAAPAILIGALVVIVGTFLDWASGTVIDATGTTQTETLDLSGFNVPDARIYAIDVSFAALDDASEREYLNNLPTSLVLPPEAVDRLRAAAGTIVLQSPEFKRLLHETGARLVETPAH